MKFLKKIVSLSRHHFLQAFGKSNKILLIPKQFTEEKLGTSERTELDSYFESLLERADSTKNFTEKILGDAEAYMVSEIDF